MSRLGSIAGGGTKPSDVNSCKQLRRSRELGSFRAWFKRRPQLRGGGVDARIATPPDPRRAHWGRAGCRQLDPSHPADLSREDWRKVVGMFRDSEFMRQVDEECLRMREAEREAARRGELAE